MRECTTTLPTLPDLLKEAGRSGRKGITFIEGGSAESFLSYKELGESSLRALSYLQEKGIKPKDELVFQVRDNRTFIITFWACILGGIIPVPLTLGQNDDRKQKLFTVFSVLNNPYLVTSDQHVRMLETFAKNEGLDDLYSLMRRKIVEEDGLLSAKGEGMPSDAGEEDVAFIQFSSGSTGSPKGVVLTHKNLWTNMRDISHASAYSVEDSTLSWMPLTHDMGLIGFHLNPIFNCIDQFLMDTSLFIRRPSLWLESASHHKTTILCSPNFGYAYVLRHCDLSKDHSWDLSRVRIIYNGAEPIAEKLCSSFTERLSPFGLLKTAMLPVYGLAEATLAVTISALEDTVLSRRSFVNVGRPVDHCRVRITDEMGCPCQEDTVGHVQIKGQNVTSGYYNNVQETDRVISSEGWLDTGDLGFLSAGCLFITGRVKDIIFVNGLNYYPHDIERVAEEIEGIELNKIAVAGFFNEKTQKEECIAFVLHRGALESFLPFVRTLKPYINGKTGLELDRILPVKDIPRTTSGKLQRFKLIRQYKSGAFDPIEKELAHLMDELPPELLPGYIPRSETEEKLVEIWKKVLGVADIAVTDNFFDAGGNSLKAAAMEMALWKEFGAELPMDLLFEKPTIRELAPEIDCLSPGGGSPPEGDSPPARYTPIDIVPERLYYPASSSQRGIYYSWESDKTAVAYNLPLAFRITGHLDTSRLEDSIRQLILRHDSFSMSFRMGDLPEFRIGEEIGFILEQINCPEAGLNEKLKSLVRPFDLAQPPLFRFCLIRTERDEWILFADFHHIISDGLSVFLFLQELQEIYAGSILPAVPIRYKDYACWEKDRLQSGKLNIPPASWLDQFRGEIPVLELPADFHRPAVFDTRGEKIEYTLDKACTAQLRRMARENACTLSTLLFTVYTVLLSKYSGQENIIIGIPVAGRRHPDLQGVLGMFVNNIAIRSSLSADEPFVSLVNKTGKLITQAMAYQDYPFEWLIKERQRDFSRNPLFDTMFIYQNMGFPDSGGFSLSRHFFDPGFSKYDLSVEIFEEEETLKIGFEYSTRLFRRTTALGIQQHFDCLIRSVIAGPNRRIVDLEMISDEEYKALLADPVTIDRPAGTTIHGLFEEQAAKTPDAVAVEWGQFLLTYRELNEASGRIADLLQQKGAGAEAGAGTGAGAGAEAGAGAGAGRIIGVLMDRSPELIVSILGILKAGACYLPIDPSLPEERIKFLIGDYEQVLPGLYASGMNDEVAGLAYIIYTSGTTGLPKGVMIAHGSLVNYISWAATVYCKGEKAAFPLCTSISFDLTVTSIFVPLITGGRIIVYGEKDGELPIEKVLADNKTDVIKLTPSHLRLLAENRSLVSGSGIRGIIVGGEQLETRLAREIYDLFDGKAAIFNEYGPTEATVGCMIHRFQPEEDLPAVPIGIPAAGTCIYILDRTLQPAATGIPGELYISGAGVARGYLFNEDATREKFLPDPFRQGQRMYKTGDIAKRQPDGTIVYIGRADRQVKVNGYRIELGEIEYHLKCHPLVREGIVQVKAGKNGQKNIYAWVSAEGGLKETELMEYLAGRLPYYMLPVQLIFLEEIPLTRNGKVDYAALSIPETMEDKESGPCNDIEVLSLDIWENVLGENGISVTDSFFLLGGDSIKAIQVSSRLREKGVIVNVRDILTYHTIRQISGHASLHAGSSNYNQGRIEGEKAFTPIETWFFGQRFANPDFYNQSILLEWKKEINHNLLEKAFKKLVEYHDGLRLNFKDVLYYNNHHLDLPFHIERKEVEAARLPALCQDLRSGFRLTASLLLKAAIISVDGEAEYLFITAHHLVIDGISWRILLEDLFAAYTSLLKAEEVRFPGKTASLTDWQKGLNQYARSERLEDETGYWHKIDNTAFHIPLDHETNNWETRHQGRISGTLDKEKTNFLLKGAHHTYHTDVPILLNTALAMALRDWTGSRVLIIEQEDHGRRLDTIDTSRTIGWFTAMYPVRIECDEAETGELILAIKEQLRSVPRNGIGYGFRKTRSFAQREVRFNYLGRFDDELDNDLFLFSRQDTGNDIGTANHMTVKIEINVMVLKQGLTLTIHYNKLAHDQRTIEKFREKYFEHLHAILDFLGTQDEIRFSPSDFDAAGLSKEDLQEIFG